MFNASPRAINDRPANLERLRICVIASTYPRHAQDYAVPWLRESIAQLADRGHEITVLAPSYQGLASHTIDGVPVVRFRYWFTKWEQLTHEQGAPNRIRNPLYQVQGLPYVLLGCRTARQLARRTPFDIIHAHWPFPHEPIGSAAAGQCGAPLIITAHGAEFALARRKSWVRACLRRSLLKADSLIANSGDTAAHIAQLSGRTADVIPFGSTVQPKNQSPPVPGHSGPPRVLFTGRLIQRKGVEYLLHAAQQLLRTQQATFVITGDGDQRDYLLKLSGELGLERYVHFLGFISNEELNEEYAKCDVWVNPAIVDDRGDTEGLGVGAIEAYAHGKPVVSTNVGGIPDVVIDRITGLLVPQRNPTALAQAIVELLQDKNKSQRFAAAGLRHVQQRFSWSTITNQLEAVYWRSLLHSRADSRVPCTESPAEEVPTGVMQTATIDPATDLQLPSGIRPLPGLDQPLNSFLPGEAHTC